MLTSLTCRPGGISPTTIITLRLVAAQHGSRSGHKGAAEPSRSTAWPSATLKRQCASVEAAKPSAQELPAATSGYTRNQLQRAIETADIDACLYLLTQYGAEDGLTLTSSQLRTLAGLALDRGRTDQAVALLRALPNAGPRQFSVLMGECLHRRNSKALAAVLAARRAAGLRPDAYTASAEITALGASKRSGEAVLALRRAWKERGCRKVEVCNAAIGACAAAGDWKEAAAVMELLQNTTGVSPDTVTYNSLMKAAGAAGMMSEVRRLYEDLEASGLKPSPTTYSTLFTAAARNKHQDPSWLLRTFRSMRVSPNDFVLSSFFTAMSVAGKCTSAQREAVFEALADGRSRGPLNDITYAALLAFVTRQGIAERAIDVWTAALQDGVALSPHLFSSLFAACTAGSSPALVDIALDAYADLREWWGAQDKRRVAAWMERDALVAYNALMHFIGEAGQLEEALVVLEDMKREGPLPDVVTYNTAIAACGRAGDSVTALHLFREMSSSTELTPTDRTFGSLLHAFARVGDAESARQVFDSLEEAGVEPNVVLYTSFIDALVKAGDEGSLSLAFQVADDMRSRGHAPSAVTYGCLMSACEKLGDVPRAFALYRRACADGILPSDEMHDILINACTHSGKLDEALDLVKTTARSHARLQQHTLDSLVRALCGSSPGRALRMLSLMQAKGMAPSAATYVALVGACARASDGIEALALYRSMRAQGMEVDSAAGSALISCLCVSGDLPQAVQVYEEMMEAAWGPRDAREKKGNTRGRAEKHVSRGEEGAANGSRVVRRRDLPKRAQVPSASALASLTQAFAERGRLQEAWRFYMQLRRLPMGLEDATVSHRRLFEALIEGHCRQQKLERALMAFDDWKSASARWFARSSPSNSSTPTTATAAGSCSDGEASQASPPKRRQPKLSNVSLAFLEACCRAAGPSLAWRMYDVCAVMREQKERKLQENLARPEKASHHVMGSVDHSGMKRQ
jgi:pentatricopeptide repeat protein